MRNLKTSLLIVLTISLLFTLCACSPFADTYVVPINPSRVELETEPHNATATTVPLETSCAEFVTEPSDEQVFETNMRNIPEPTETTPLSTEYFIGDSFQDGNIKISYIASGEHNEEIEGSQLKDGYKYIFVEFEFNNIPSDSEDILSPSFYNFVCYTDDNPMEIHFVPGDSMESPAPLWEHVVKKFYFSIPNDAQVIEIEYTPLSPDLDKVSFIYENK
jgi:hypothetical protein